eukprot:2406455-Heterocapsa_arctica.AAC.1
MDSASCAGSAAGAGTTSWARSPPSGSRSAAGASTIGSGGGSGAGPWTLMLGRGPYRVWASAL